MEIKLRHEWNEDEIELLKNHFDEFQTIRELWKRYFSHRSYRSVSSKCNRLGLMKYKQKEVRYVHNGYWVVKKPECPFSSKKDGFVYEHRYIWWLHNQEDWICADEVIHHLNEDKLDNRIENLEKRNIGKHTCYHKILNKEPEPYEPWEWVDPDVPLETENLNNS